MTRSSVTSPADPTYRLYQPSERLASELTVSGTSDGRADESVDIVCSRGALIGTVADNVPLSGDGTFTTDVELSALPRAGCILRAVPHLYRGKELQPFDGPLVAVTYYDPNDFPVPVRGGGDPVIADYYVETGHRRGRSELRSAGSDGLEDLSGVHPEELGAYTRDTWDGGASLESSIEVDDRVAYAAGSIPRLVYAPEERPAAPAGFDGLEVELTLDERTGRVTVEESQRVLRCDRWDRPKPRQRTAPRCWTPACGSSARSPSTPSMRSPTSMTGGSAPTTGTPPAARLRARRGRVRPSVVAVPRDPRFTFRADQDRVRPKGPGTVFVRGPRAAWRSAGSRTPPLPRPSSSTARTSCRRSTR